MMKIKYFAVIILFCSALVGVLAAASTTLETRGRTVRIKVDKTGFSPASVNATAGRELRLVFNRTDQKNCGKTVVFPDLNIRKDLPVGKNVTVTLNPTSSGEIKFTCGMGMYRGSVVVSR
jgi:plastocyanin domain-containing protein